MPQPQFSQTQILEAVNELLKGGMFNPGATANKSVDPNATFGALSQLLGGNQAGGFAPSNYRNVKSLTPDIYKAYTNALGLVPYDLQGPAKFIQPTFSPLRNMIPRDFSGQGNARQFKVITGINTTNQSLFAAEGTLGNATITTALTVTFPYLYQALRDSVTWEAQQQSRGFEDLMARASTLLLKAFMVGEEKNIIGAQSQAAVTGASVGGGGVSIGGSSTAPATPATATATTGGTIAAGTYNVVTTAVTYMGESLASVAANQVTSGATSTITVTPNQAQRAVGSGSQPILSYNIYWKLSTDATYNKVSTTGAAVVLSSYTLDTKTLPAGDTTGNALAYNGIFPQIAANGSGAYKAFVNGPLTLAALGTMVKSMWDTVQADPNMFLVNSQESGNITDLVLGAANTPYFLVVKDQDQATGGYRVGRLVNKITGSEIQIMTHPYMPAGNLLALTTELPDWYAGSDIDSVWSMVGVTDYTQFDYFPTGPVYPFEIRNICALVLQLPATQGWLGGLQ